MPLQAHKERRPFRVYVMMPLLPGDVGGSTGISVSAITHWNYASKSRGRTAIRNRLQEAHEREKESERCLSVAATKYLFKEHLGLLEGDGSIRSHLDMRNISLRRPCGTWYVLGISSRITEIYDKWIPTDFVISGRSSYGQKRSREGPESRLQGCSYHCTLTSMSLAVNCFANRRQVLFSKLTTDDAIIAYQTDTYTTIVKCFRQTNTSSVSSTDGAITKSYTASCKTQPITINCSKAVNSPIE